MKPTKDAKKIALKSYSMWANYLGIAALIAPEVIYYVWTIDTNPKLWWFLGLGLILFGIIGRLINQGITRSPFVVVVFSVFLAMAQIPSQGIPQEVTSSSSYTQKEFLSVAVPHIAKWEGLRTKAYRDIVGVWTVCYGETKGVQPGDTYTKAQCEDMLAREVVSYQQGWHQYLNEKTLSDRLNPYRDTAYTSLAYNVGISGAGKSTATRRLNNGNIAGGCKAITWWNKAGNRVVRGLVNRRKDDYQLCMMGVS